MTDTVPRPATIHPLLRPAYAEAKRRWRKSDPTAFSLIVSLHTLSELFKRRSDCADVVAALIGGMLPAVEGGDA